MTQTPRRTIGDSPVRVVLVVKGQRRFNVMAKPMGPACNLDCAYCYYLSKERLLGLSGHSPMSDDILEKFIRDYISDNDALQIEFEWQGGEPTLLGVEFFRKVVDLQKKHCPPNKRILNSLQTNGLLLERDGNLYSCDHFVYPEFRLGNILERPLVDTAFSGRQARFGFAKTDTLPEYCRECEYLFACWGECPKNRFVKTPDARPGLNYLCGGLKRFFEHADPFLKQIVTKLKPE